MFFGKGSPALATAIVIVNYKNTLDVQECVASLADLIECGEIGIFIVENGGAEAFDALVEGLIAPGGPCVVLPPHRLTNLIGEGTRHKRCSMLETAQKRRLVAVAEATDNLGYGGGINSWLERLQFFPFWEAFWILNPDTTPHPKALSALRTACAGQRGAMASSTIVDYRRADYVMTRGMLWRWWRGNAVHVDGGKRIGEHTAPGGGTAIDSPSGTSIYVTRACLDQIGYIKEDYFLYYEDLEWGMRAKKAGLLVRADSSIVPHKYGTTIGSAIKRKDRSRIAVYLETRNNLRFNWSLNPYSIVWILPRTILRAFEYLLVGSSRNAAATLAGVGAFLRGESGRPNFIN